MPTNEFKLRFWDKVDTNGDAPQDCWNWDAPTRVQSYGAVWMDKRLHTAHRVAWLLTYGEIEKGKCIGQRCGNPLCVRPTHLVSGTKKELYDLRLKLGLGGEDPMALTEGQAREIREHYFHDRIPMASLARHYGVGLGAIDKVLRQPMR